MVVLDVLLAVGFCGLAALLVVVGVQAQADPNAPHGGAFSFLGALLVGPAGLLFALAGAAVARRWRIRWGLQALPVLVLAWAVLFGVGIF